MNSKKSIPEFGIKRPNEERRDGGCAVVFDPYSQRYAVGLDNSNGVYRLYSGGVDETEDLEKGILREVEEESGLYEFQHFEKVAEAISHYYNHLRNVNRVAHATCLLVILKSTNLKEVHHEAHENFSLIWVSPDEILKNWEQRNENKDFDHWYYFLKKSVNRAKELKFDRTS